MTTSVSTLLLDTSGNVNFTASNVSPGSSMYIWPVGAAGTTLSVGSWA